MVTVTATLNKMLCEITRMIIFRYTKEVNKQGLLNNAWCKQIGSVSLDKDVLVVVGYVWRISVDVPILINHNVMITEK